MLLVVSNGPTGYHTLPGVVYPDWDKEAFGLIMLADTYPASYTYPLPDPCYEGSNLSEWRMDW